MGALKNLKRIRQNIKVTLNGWRFNDLKQHITDSVEEIDLGFRLNHSESRLPISSEKLRLAVISCMPPAETGISTCTLLSFREAEYPVDIFTTYPSNRSYLMGVNDRRLRGTKVEVFELSVLPEALHRRRYEACVLIIGNSDHNVTLMKYVRDLQHFGIGVPLHVYIHDPCLLNLCHRVMAAENREISEVLARYYGVGASQSLDYAELVDRRVFGIRPLLSDLGVSSIIVNSETANSMVSEEMPGTPVHTLFHPVLPLTADPQPRGRELRIGTFGVPERYKKTELVVAAFEKVRERRPDARLLIVGFAAGKYAIDNQLRAENGYDIHDTPNDQEFDRLLASVDVAVQLRARNLGESSGVIPRLLRLGIPTLASADGAFSEYAEAVRPVSANATADELADAILAEAENPHVRASAVEDYVAERTPQQFCRKMASALKLSFAKDFHLTDQTRDSNVVVFGYYGHNNAGDDAFGLAFEKMFPGKNIVLKDYSQPDEYVPRIIMGGGALINEYFFGRLPKFGRLDVIGCSLPYGEGDLVHLERVADKIGILVFRSRQDTAAALAAGLPARYAPDIVFTLDPPEDGHDLQFVERACSLQNVAPRRAKTVAVFVSDHYATGRDDPCFNTIDSFRNNLARSLDVLATKYNVVLIPMSNWYNANDFVFAHDVVRRMKAPDRVFNVDTFLEPKDIMRVIGGVADVVISMRYHGLIFSYLCGIPAINLGNARKNLNLMTELALSNLSIPLEIFDPEILDQAVAFAGAMDRSGIAQKVGGFKSELADLTAELRASFEH